MKKKVVSLVFNNFKNDSRVLKECTSLVNAGYDVTVVALYEPGLAEHEEMNGVKVHRMKLASRGKGLPKVLFTQVFIYLELAWKIIQQYTNNVDIIHCNDLDPLPIASIIKKRSKRPVKIVYDIHEFQTETMKYVLKPIRKKPAVWTETTFIKNIDASMTVSEGIAVEYAKRYGIKQPELVLNCPNYQEIERTNTFRELFPIRPDQKILLYQGAFGKGRGIEVLIDGFEKLNRDDVALIFMGYGPIEHIVKAAVERNPNIHYQTAVPHKEIMKYTSSADVGVSLIENSCLNYYYCLPNKLFEYGMAGLPILASNLPEMRRIVKDNECGDVAEQLTAEGIAEAIERLLRSDLARYSANSLEMAKKYHWGIQEETLLRVYRELN